MSEILDQNVNPNPQTDPYAEAAAALEVPSLQQALLVWDALEALDEHPSEHEEARLHALVHTGMQIIPIRDYVMGQMASLPDPEWEPFMQALSACASSAPEQFRGQVAASCAMLGAGFDLSPYVIEQFLCMDTGTNLARLVRNGQEMRAPAHLYRHSMRSILPSIINDLSHR